MGELRVAIVGAGPSGLAALRALDARGLRRHGLRARRAARRRLDARGPADRRLPLAAPDHEPRAHRVRRASDAGRHARLSEPRRRRPLPGGATSSASGCTSTSGSAAGVERAERLPAGGWELELAGGRAGERRRARGRQRPQRRAALAGPALPRATSTASSCTRSTTTTPSRHARQARARGRDGQQRDGHRHRPLARRRAHAAVGAARELGDPQAPAGQAGRPGGQAVGGGPRAVADPPAAVAAAAAGGGRAARALRPAGAPARPVPGPPDDLRHDPQPHQPRARSRPSRASTELDRRRRALRRRDARRRWTRSSGAPATAWRCRSCRTSSWATTRASCRAYKRVLPPRRATTSSSWA